jgi:hypothetical protein
MVLSSQMVRQDRPRGGRNSSRRRGRSALAPWLVLGVVGLLAVGLWWWTGQPQEESQDLPGGGLSQSTPSLAGEALRPLPPVTVTPAAAPMQNAPASSPSAPAPAPAAPARVESPAPVVTVPQQPDLLDAGRTLLQKGMTVQGRAALSAFLFEDPPRIDEHTLQGVRDVLADLNERLVFGPGVVPDDPLVEQYVVQSGDLLARLAPRYKVPFQALVRINKVEPARIRVGQKLKMIRGPFHVIVDKSEYRLDLYLMDMTNLPIYVRSFPVGLGEDNATPVGKWRVEPGRKVANPAWKNPRTGEYFAPEDPKNPIGEHWIALEGLDDNTRAKTGYGIHGTVDPHSIGAQMSMGCIRMRDEDVALLFDLLVEGDSLVTVRP